MEIEVFSQPVAGEGFNFRVTGGTRPTHIEVYIDRRLVLDTECTDPPCHEMVFIPRGTRGAELWIIARDIFGSIEQQKFAILDSDASAGGAMATEA